MAIKTNELSLVSSVENSDSILIDTEVTGSARITFEDAVKYFKTQSGIDGLTASVTELNYVKGVTSAIQTQLNSKAASSHTHSYLPLEGGTLTGNLNMSKKTIDNVLRIKGRTATDWLYISANSIHCTSYSSDSSYVPVYASAYSTGSSIRYKNVIGDMPKEEINKIFNVELKEFTYKTDESKVPKYGVIAEQLDNIGLTFPVTYNEQNEPEGVDYSRFTPYLISLIQAHEKEIKELKEEILTLKNQ